MKFLRVVEDTNKKSVDPGKEKPKLYLFKYFFICIFGELTH